MGEIKKENKQANLGKIALKAGFWYVLSSIAVKMISIITTPLFTRVLSTDEYGMVATFISWHALLIVVFSMNLDVSIGRAKIDYPEHLDSYIGSIGLLSFIVSIIMSIVIIFLFPFLQSILSLDFPSTILLLSYLSSTPIIVFAQASFRYKYQYKENIMIALYISVATAVVSVLLIFTINENRAIGRMLGIVIPSVALAIVFIIKTLYKGNAKPNFEYWKYGLLISVPMILHNISLNILAQSDRIVINQYFGDTPVAYYSLVRNYSLLVFTITEAINQAWRPWFHDNFNMGNMDLCSNKCWLNISKLVCVVITITSN